MLSGQENQLVESFKQSFLSRPVPPGRMPVIANRDRVFYNQNDPLSIRFPLLLGDVPPFTSGNRTAIEAGMNKFAEMCAAGTVTPFAKAVQAASAGRNFIDLGCGTAGNTYVMRRTAAALGAKRYIGAEPYDMHETFIKNDGFESYFFNEDMLSFLSRVNTGEPLAFFLSGIGPISNTDPASKEYIRASLEEMQRATKKGDSLILYESYGFEPESFGFRKVAQGEAERRKASVYMRT